jgi:hypothetical protein
MTIKDLAEMTVNFGLVCQKCVPSRILVFKFMTHLLPEACPQLARLSQPISDPTLCVAKHNKITLYCFATYSPAQQQTTIFYPRCTLVPVAHTAPPNPNNE